MKIMKFGGSSVATPERIREVAGIVLAAAKTEQIVVVLSAYQGVTNALLACAVKAEKGGDTYFASFEEIARRHRSAIEALFGRKKGATVRSIIEQQLAELRDALHGISLLRYSPPRAMDLVASFGERLSSVTFAHYLKTRTRSVFVDSRSLVVTDDNFMNAAVRFDQTDLKTQAFFSSLYRTHGRNAVAVVTGFVGATEDGRTTTIGRNGSDYTAAIVGGALNAGAIEIWTDVDGVLSADPKAVASAFVLAQLSYEEAMEMSYFGASVLHSATIAPAVAKSIPIIIKNTLNPAAPGTRISGESDNRVGAAKGISSIDDITLLTLRGLSMVGVPGTAQRLFGCLAAARVNVILISQASSEHTICFAVKAGEAAHARKAITHEFRYDLQNGLTSLDEKSSQTIMAVVGEGMRGTPGVSGKVFNTLGRGAVNISAIAQGASERNISFVVDSSNKKKALTAVHDAFFLPRRVLSLVVMGVGNVGAELLNQLHAQNNVLAARGFELRVVACASSKYVLVQREGINLGTWKESLRAHPCIISPEELADTIAGLNLADVALVDCTAQQNVADAYPQFINAGCHIVTPNKLANVLPRKRHADLLALFEQKKKKFFYEANVGAGLPVIQTLKDLVATGDTIYSIEGTLSGTLSFLFNSFDGSVPFSQLVRDAHERGYTEPDPREDLSGNDIARKLLIVAREIGVPMDLRDVHVHNLVPASLRGGPLPADFYKRFARNDDAMLRLLAEAGRDNAVLRYVGSVKGRKATAGLQRFPLHHPFATARGNESIVVFTTKRYEQLPLVIRGNGAGAAVTAMGVFSDILKLMYSLPHV